MSTRVCSTCKQEKSIDFFSVDNSERDGIRRKCKKCCNQGSAKYYKENSEALKDYAKEWRKLNPEKVKAIRLRRVNKPEQRREQYTRGIEGVLFRAARIRARREGLPFNLEKSDIVVPSHCPVLGLELKCGKEKASDYSPSVDKVLSELGYVKGNIRVISLRANRLKSDATPEELFKISEYVKAHINVGIKTSESVRIEPSDEAYIGAGC